MKYKVVVFLVALLILIECESNKKVYFVKDGIGPRYGHSLEDLKKELNDDDYELKRIK